MGKGAELLIVLPSEAVRAYISDQLATLVAAPLAEAKHRIVQRFAVDYIEEMLRRTGGNINQAAKLSRSPEMIGRNPSAAGALAPVRRNRGSRQNG